jgi:hypothetical protein
MTRGGIRILNIRSGFHLGQALYDHGSYSSSGWLFAVAAVGAVVAVTAGVVFDATVRLLVPLLLVHAESTKRERSSRLHIGFGLLKFIMVVPSSVVTTR